VFLCLCVHVCAFVSSICMCVLMCVADSLDLLCLSSSLLLSLLCSPTPPILFQVEMQQDMSRAAYTDPEGIEFDHDEVRPPAS